MSIIEQAEALQLISNYKDQRSVILRDEFDISILTLSETFQKEDFESLLNQTGCTNIRAYIGMDDRNNLRFIFIGVNSKNQDILENNIIIERGMRCPNNCPPASDINP